MPKLFGVDVSDDVYNANIHQIEQTVHEGRTSVEAKIRRLAAERLERQFDDIWLHVGGAHDFWEVGVLFDTERGWHLDRYNAGQRIGVEIHGGQFMKVSGHSSVKGQQRDWEKLNRCNELGITLWAFTTAMVNAEQVERLLNFCKRG